MGYKFIFLPDALKQLRALDQSTVQRILKKLQWIEKQKDPLHHSVPLHYAAIGDIRFRIGDYRVIGLLDPHKKQITIAAIGHRREIYT